MLYLIIYIALIPSRPSDSESFILDLEVEIRSFKLHSSLDALRRVWTRSE